MKDVFYCAESVLLSSCRGQGAGHAFFDRREAHAARLGFGKVAFCGVVRPADHPARPEGYRPLDGFWRARGYAPLDGCRRPLRLARYRRRGADQEAAAILDEGPAVKIATAAYPLDFLPDWDAYVAKTNAWVDRAVGAGADLLVFPEYGRMELATLDGAEVAGDLERSLRAAARWTEKADELMAYAARTHSVHILSGSGPVFDAAVAERAR
jgi:hypothetical protein